MQNNITYTARNILSRDFILGFFAFLAILSINSALFPAFPMYLNELGTSEGHIGILIGIFGASSLVARFLAGGALTRYSERGIMICGTLLYALTFGFCIFFRPFWPLFFVRMLQGVAIAFMDTAALSFVVRLAPQAYKGQAISYFMLAPTLSLALAPSPGVYLVNRYGFVTFFLVCIGFSFTAFTLCYQLRRHKIHSESKEPYTGPIYIDPKMVAPAIVGFLHNFVWGSLTAFVPLYSIQLRITNPGYFFLAISITVLICRAFGAKIVDTYSKGNTILISMLTSIGTIIILSFSNSLFMFFIAGLLWGVGGAFIFPTSMAYALEYTGSSGGPSIGTFRALMDLGLTVGPMIMGMIIPVGGYRIMFFCLVFLCFINLVYFQFYLRKRSNVVI